MVEILKHLFTPEMPSIGSDQDMKMAHIQTAFSILVNVSMVKEFENVSQNFSQIKSVSYFYIHMIHNHKHYFV